MCNISLIKLDSAVGTVSTLRTGQPRNRSWIPVKARDFYLFQNIQTGSRDHPISTRVKRARREANHSILSSTEFNVRSGVIHPRLHLSAFSPQGQLYPRFVSYLCWVVGAGDIWGYFSSPYIILLLLYPHISTLLCNLLATQHDTTCVTSGPYVTAILPWTWLQQVTLTQTPRTHLPDDTRPAI